VNIEQALTNAAARAREFVRIRISPTIANEYANRCPEWLPETVVAGVNDMPLGLARAILSDADFNCNPRAQTVGPHDMPLPTFNAYRALAKQVRAAIARATGNSS